MGKPAARIGDTTAHGGKLVVGCPTVLIGGMPAARIGDMHVCPLATPAVPPVPHVGAPVSLGSAGVMIGGVPAARVGDMAPCTGPPDTIATGCFTVLIGEVGGGGGGGGGGAAATASGAAHAALVGEPGPEGEGPHWIDIQFKDSAGHPITEVGYELTGVEGQKEKGYLTKDGAIRRGGLPDEGEYTVILYKVYNAKWSTTSSEPGEVIELSAETIGYEDGTKAFIRIWERNIDGADDLVTGIYTTVQDGKIEGEWKYEHRDEKTESSGEEGESFSAPDYYFIVHVGHDRARSDILELKDWIEVELRDEDDQPVADKEYILDLPNGEVRRGTLDENGFAREEDIFPGRCKIQFLGVDEEETGFLSIVVFNDTGRTPIADTDYSIVGPDGTEYSGTTNSEGYLFHADVPIDDYELTIGDTTVIVPAVRNQFERHLQRIVDYEIS